MIDFFNLNSLKNKFVTITNNFTFDSRLGGNCSARIIRSKSR